jgi:hypothetical protein
MKGFQRPCRRLVQAVMPVIFALLLPFLAFCQSGLPPFPPDPFLDSYSFEDTNWLSDIGYAPIAFTNLVSVLVWDGDALLLDTTNSLPAFLNYNIVESDGNTNIAFSAGVVTCIFICDWATADTNQNGAGPGDAAGDPAYLLAAGDFSSNSPDGLWAIYFDPGGTNIYFGGVSNSESTVFVSAPISWPSNSVHLIGLIYSTNSLLYLDGQLAATGGPVTIVPTTNVWTNGFFIGSDSAGFEQARGVFWYLELDDSAWFGQHNYGHFFTHSWPFISNAYYASQGLQSGSGADFAPGSLLPVGGSGNYVTGTNACNVFMTNMSYAVVPGQGGTYTFKISGGAPGYGYDVFCTANLANPLSNSVWTWLGQGTNGGIYSITNQPNTPSFYILGTPQDSDGDGITDAYDNLILHISPYNPDVVGDGICNGFKLLAGLPLTTPVSLPSLNSVNVPCCPIP